MSANAHTAVMTDLGSGFRMAGSSPLRGRASTGSWRTALRPEARVDIQRAVLFTQSMMQTVAYPQVLRTALAIQYMMEHIEVVIQPHELIVGTAGGPGRCWR